MKIVYAYPKLILKSFQKNIEKYLILYVLQFR